MPIPLLSNPLVLLSLLVFVISVVTLAFYLLGKGQGVHRRVEGLSGVKEGPVERIASERMRSEEKKEKLRERLIQAGLYGDRLPLFQIARMLMLFGPALLAIAFTAMGYMSLQVGMVVGLMAGMMGTLAPSFWLDHGKRKRQARLRRALPDALDVMVVCLQGGLSLNGALARVAREIAMAHPMLAVELTIAERQIRMGKSTGEAIQEMGRRFDLEELRSMASAIIQAERIGSSVSTALDVFGESLRLKRQQRAEAMAQTAGVKILFPTLFCIFPAIFIVILGPAAIQIYNQLILGTAR